jgi:twitching motility protein PilU
MELSELLQMMKDRKASDMFLTAGLPPMMKVGGKTAPISDKVLTPDVSMAVVTGMMSPAQREEFEATKECNFAISDEEIGRFRVSAFIQSNYAGAVLRRIENFIPSIEDLNLPPILKNLSMTKRGLIVFIGATGTGKSTSLASMLDYRNKNGDGHIITIEDPIEFVHKHQGCIITQREIGIDTESYETALKNTLRQAPDVILIGEIRDRETMNHAIAFAETGHLCLATLHANNANQALDRIINFFPEERRPQLLMDLSMNLKAFLAQQLIPRKDGNGRRVCVEILLGTPLVHDVIRKGEIHKLKELMKQSSQQGMITFDQALFNLYKEGEISFDDALHYADSANEIRLMVKLDEADVDKMAESMDNVFLQEMED